MHKYTQMLASLSLVVAVVAGLVALAAFRQLYEVVPVDCTDGNPPFAKPVNRNRFTSAELDSGIKATGGRVEDILEDDDR